MRRSDRARSTVRDEATAAVFLVHASELSEICASLTTQRLLAYLLHAHGVPLEQLEIRPTLASSSTGLPQNPNADVKSLHTTIETEFFALADFHGPITA